MPAGVNSKTRKKIWIDIIMTVLFIFSMNLSWTGILWHEILSMAAAALLAAHLLINRTWIRNIAVMLKAKNGLKTKLTLTLNTLLGLAAAVTFLSGILISEYLFVPLASANISFWMDVHSISSTAILMILIIHTLFHWRWIQGLIKRLRTARGAASGQKAPEAGMSGAWLPVLSARLLIVAVTLATVYTLATSRLVVKLLPDEWTLRLYAVPQAQTTNVTRIHDETTATWQTTLTTSGGTGDQTAISPSPAPTETEPAISLQEYLSKLRCTGCDKNCLLSSPRCSRGERQAEEAKQDYYASRETAET